MKPKNIMLLGFVNKAVDYLEKHMDEEPDTRLAELKNIDLASLKEELSDYLDSSLGTMQSTMSTLLKAGNEAFDQFIEVNHKENISDQFSRMLDVDFDDEKKTSQEELAKLLSFYNLEDFDAENTEEVDLPQNEELEDIHIEDIDVPQNEEDLPQDKQLQDSQTKDEEVTLDEVLSIPQIDEKEEPEIEEFVIQEDEEFIIPQTDEEDIPHFADTEVLSEDDRIMEEIKKNITNDDVDDILHIDENETDPEIDTIFSEIIENEGKPVNTVEEQITKLEAPEFKEVTIEDEINNADYAKIFDSLPLENPAVDEEKVEELLVEETPEVETQDYVNSLIDELREQMIKEDAAKKQEEEKEKEIYNTVHKIYPNLSEAFVKAAYKLKQPLADEYPINKKLIILHRISFDDVDNLRKFVEIGLSHDYTINADEKKLIVDIIKEFINSDGKILTNIFEVANQGSVLHGNYEGYNILSNE